MSNRRRNTGLNATGGPPISLTPSSVHFSPLPSAEIRALSVCSVVNPNSFNQLGHPNPNGLYDLRMGPFTEGAQVTCATCQLSGDYCPGHLGHIDLPLPVCNPLYHNELLQALKLGCIHCHKLRAPDYLRELLVVRQTLLDRGLIVAAQMAAEASKTDPGAYQESDDGRKKRTVNDAALVYNLRQFYEDAVASAETSMVAESAEKHTRSVEELRRRYRKEFVDASKGGGVCKHCGAHTLSVRRYRNRIIYEGAKLPNEDQEEMMKDNTPSKTRVSKVKVKAELNAEELRRHFRELWQHEAAVLAHVFPALKRVALETRSEHPTDIFFLDLVAVPPPRSRPCQIAAGSMTLHPQSQSLQYVVENAGIMRAILKEMRGVGLSEEETSLLKTIRGDRNEAKLDLVWKELQSNVDHVLDKDMNKSAASKIGFGFKQLIERKQGLFRMHMMGKRVNFAARTVITPDPNIDVDEIGLPEVFAKNLTYREPVTPFNVDMLRDMVMNGPESHPGANAVEMEDGTVRYLQANNPVQREAVAKMLLSAGDGENKGKFVHRHLVTGDAMLLNRQPTLHKPSIMSHRARVLKSEKVMRLHYAICKSYNADFDGDEMNAHFPQNEVARSEAYNVVNVCKQFLVPKDGTPLQVRTIKKQMSFIFLFFTGLDPRSHYRGCQDDNEGQVLQQGGIPEARVQCAG